MYIRNFIFAILVIIHFVIFILAPESISPLIAGSVYLPLWMLSTIGIPVFGAANSGGWETPSLLGWVVVFCIWSAIWFTVTTLLYRLFIKNHGRA